MSAGSSVPGSVRDFLHDSGYSRERTPSLGEAPAAGPLLTGGRALPPPHAPQMMPLGEALRSRRTCRDFQPAPLSLGTLSTLLSAAAGARTDAVYKQQTMRHYPSAGALYPLRLHLVALRVEGLPVGVYHYQAGDHTLHPAGPPEGDVRPLLERMLGGWDANAGVGAASVLFLFTAHLPGITSKYASRGLRFALQESGHLAQNLMLAAAGEGLGSLALGNFLDDCAAEVVGTALDTEPVVYVLACGQPVPASRQAQVPTSEVPEPVEALEARVLAQVLGVSPVDEALAPLVEGYRAAGRSALRAPAHPWWQWRLITPSPRALFNGPVGQTLQALEAEGAIEGMWFLCKSQGGPHVRLRVLPTPGADTAGARARLERSFTEGQAEQVPSRVYATIYEPEMYLFGGPRGLELVHTLFMLDSRLALEAGRRERRVADRISQLWSELVLRHAGLDIFERWDVWRKVGLSRPGVSPQMEPLLAKMRPAIQAVFEAKTDELDRNLREALPEAARLCERLVAWGQALQHAAQHGALERPVRELLATCIVFHWNRMLYQNVEQVFLARLWAEGTRPPA